MKSDNELLRAALVGYQHQYDQIEAKMAEIRGQMGTAPAPVSGPRRRKMSASTRLKMAAAQKRRWAGLHEGQGAAPRQKRKMSAAGRKRIAEATRKRWAEYLAQKASSK